jgi:hypothetical protein
LIKSFKRPWFFLTLIAVVLFVAIEHGPIAKQWTAMFPADRRQKTALRLCYSENNQSGKR